VILHAIGNEDPQQSLQLLHRALGLDPDSSTAAYYLAGTYRADEDDALAVKWYSYALERGRFDERFAEDKNGKVNAANSERAYYQLLDTLMHARRWAEAWPVAQEFIEEHPQSAKAYFQFGELHLNLVLYKATTEITETLVEAERALQRSATLDPSMPRTYYYLGRVEEEQENVPAAIEYYRQAVARDNKNQAFLWRLGSRLTWLGQYEQALPYLERSVEHIPTNPRYDSMQWVKLGDTYLAVNRCEEAKQAYLEALSLSSPTIKRLRKGLSILKTDVSSNEG
jgi:tetratricopeptide (TPR) repeat protein